MNEDWDVAGIPKELRWVQRLEIPINDTAAKEGFRNKKWLLMKNDYQSVENPTFEIRSRLMTTELIATDGTVLAMKWELIQAQTQRLLYK